MPLHAVFSDDVLGITEGDVVSANITVEYQMRGRDYVDETAARMQLYDRHAITWDDDQKAAAYVTAKDPTILEIARPVAAWIRNDPLVSFDQNFRIAMALHEAVGTAGVNYVVDPSTPYAELSADAAAIDFLQFPTNTLQYQAGDCDDLSILYASLLESVSIVRDGADSLERLVCAALWLVSVL